jgi:hypothetical protein
METHLIIEVHLMIEPSAWKTFRTNLSKNLKKINEKKLRLRALYFTYDIEDLEIRICFLVNDLELFERIIVSDLRSIKGVSATRVRLTLNGKIFPGGYKALTSNVGKKEKVISAHIFIKNQPALDRTVWRALENLKKDGNTYPTWIFRDFYEYDRDITLRIISSDVLELRKYAENNLNTIEGVISWRYKHMLKFENIVSNAELYSLAELFIK